MEKIAGIFMLGLILLGTGCVSKRQYDDMVENRAKCQEEVKKLKETERQYKKLLDEHAQLNDQMAEDRSEIADLRKKLENLEEANDDLLEKYNESLAQKSNILDASSKEKQDLTMQLTEKQKQLDEKEKRLQRLEDELRILSDDLAAREERINALSEQLDNQKEVMNRLKTRINEALLGFSASDLSVRLEDGKVYVSMSQDLLFAKGSDKIDAKGKEAIRKLSEVLVANPDIDINVEGHTDTDGTAAFNWDLSVSRATSVVKLLTTYGVKPESITASGRAYYDPIFPNDTEANKSKNRRTEIILSPRLDELYRLINQ